MNGKRLDDPKLILHYATTTSDVDRFAGVNESPFWIKVETDDIKDEVLVKLFRDHKITGVQVKSVSTSKLIKQFLRLGITRVDWIDIQYPETDINLDGEHQLTVDTITILLYTERIDISIRNFPKASNIYAISTRSISKITNGDLHIDNCDVQYVYLERHIVPSKVYINGTSSGSFLFHGNVTESFVCKIAGASCELGSLPRDKVEVDTLILDVSKVSQCKPDLRGVKHLQLGCLIQRDQPADLSGVKFPDVESLHFWNDETKCIFDDDAFPKCCNSLKNLISS